MGSSLPKIPAWVFALVAIIYFTAVRVDTMDIDASQYAEISREMMKSGDYLHVFDRGLDYLDKPPFLFWVSALSMRIFGIGNFGYKFPSLLFALWAIYATYRLARLLYNESIARMAALVLATCQGMFLMTNDVRCDTILMSCVVTAIWMILEWQQRGRLWWLWGGCAAIAAGMMTKGPIALMVPVFCFMSDWILKRQWRHFARPAYLAGLIIIAVLLIPMSIGLYQQFDLHPDKIVNGKQGVSGLRFFFWSQSFGRITGESPWKNDVDLSFLLVNMLWSFLPWILLLLPALALNIASLVKQRFRLLPGQEWISTGGFILSYLALGSSAYQLPHYIFVAFPLASIITAKLLAQFIEEGKYRGLYTFMRRFQAGLIFLLLMVSLLLLVYVFPAPVWVIVLWAAGFAAWLVLAFSKSVSSRIFWVSAGGMIIINLFVTNGLYYPLLQYQVGSVVGRYLSGHHIATTDVAAYKMDDPLNALPFYANGLVEISGDLQFARSRKYVLTMDKGLDELRRSGAQFVFEKQGKLFKVSELTPDFLNPRTRDRETKNYYLLRMR